MIKKLRVEFGGSELLRDLYRATQNYRGDRVEEKGHLDFEYLAEDREFVSKIIFIIWKNWFSIICALVGLNSV